MAKTKDWLLSDPFKAAVQKLEESGITNAHEVAELVLLAAVARQDDYDYFDLRGTLVGWPQSGGSV